jgi:hypothetical protein
MMVSVRTRGIAIVIGVVGCYSPRYRDCEIACTSDGCPVGLTCDQASGRCRSGSSCPSVDAAPLDAEFFGCWRGAGGITPTNFHPCRFDWPVGVGSWTVTGPTFVCTDSGTIGTTCPGAITQFGELYATDDTGDMVWLIHASDLTLNGTLIVRGARPLLVVVDAAIDIGASIVINASGANDMRQAICTNADGMTAQLGGTTAGGGGGGDNDGTGGVGAVDGTRTGLGGGAGQAIATPDLSPLLAGCVGATGGPANGAGGQGGNGGAGLEIVSRTAITISGKVLAAGLAGHGGTSSGGNAPGGGGGGAGGSILFEAPSIAIATGSSICAAGAGGGQGATMTTSGINGTDGTCVGGVGGTGGNGGAGGGGSSVGGQPGQSPAAPLANPTLSGGGGGGAAGRIRIHAISVAGSGMTGPAATVDSK